MSSMKQVRTVVRLLGRLAQEEKGEDVVEYGLILSFISLFVIGAAIQLGFSLESLWEVLSESLASARPF